jgi:surface antigen
MTRQCEAGRTCRRVRPPPTLSILVAAALAAGLAGCATNTETGMLVGGAGGAAAGAAIGSASGHAGSGAVIGGAIGLIGGGMVGNSMDQADRRHDVQYEYSATASPAAPITRDDIVAWSRQGAGDEVIIDRIERSGSVFHLTAADEDTLRDQGVSDDVLRAMKETGRR